MVVQSVITGALVAALGLTQLASSAPSGPVAPVPTPAPANAGAPVSVVPAIRAKGSLARLFTTDDYPAAAIRNEETGKVRFAVTVDASGRVNSCTVVASSGSASLDATTCAIVQRRARLTPARDAAGRAVADVTTGEINWVLPAPPPDPVADGYGRIIFSVSKGSKIKGCRVEANSSVPAPAETCGAFERSLAPQMAQMIKDGPQVEHEAVVEQGMLVGGAEATKALARSAGERRLVLEALALTIDASGKVTNCVPALGTTNVASAQATCLRSAGRRFVALPTDVDQSDRHAVAYMMVYTRAAPHPGH